jgi:Tfp pilus assembly protein FimT
MNRKSGLSFVDVLIIIAIVLLLASLAIPHFRKPEDFGDEEDMADDTNTVQDAYVTGVAPTNQP